MKTQRLTQYILLECTSSHTLVQLEKPHPVISSAVWNGGFVMADHIINLKVKKHSDEFPIYESPEVTLSKYCSSLKRNGLTVGMMTAASMDSLRMTRYVEQGIEIIALVTAGLANARRAGDYADYRVMTELKIEVGTINTIILTTASLTPSAMVEAVVISTEAKAVALQDLGILSPISNKIATGTGTDAIAIVGGYGSKDIQYCGKHTLFGELLARTVIESVTSSIQRD